jgi:molybdate-binding protein/DNA-binding transcriptional regulator YhcF (GntR family)
MSGTPLYQQIAEAIRKDVLYGNLNAGDRLPPVREMARRWQCTPGTVQRAYAELAGQGLVTSRPGQGTRVVGGVTPWRRQATTPLRRAALVHQAEAFLLKALSADHTLEEVEQALRVALDRWRALPGDVQDRPGRTLRFVGSHDAAVGLIAARFAELVPGFALRVAFAGSLGGLIALSEGKADLAGSHLWDEESDSYNAPFVRRLLPGRRVALLTLAHRRLGLITTPGNREGLASLADLARPGLRFVNRQRGAGTRVWLDANLRRLGIVGTEIAGYGDEELTHSAVASAIAEGRADAGLGVEVAALAYGLGFVPFKKERYDLVIPADTWEAAPVQALAEWLGTAEGKAAIADLGGYDTGETGRVRHVG